MIVLGVIKLSTIGNMKVKFPQKIKSLINVLEIVKSF